MRYMYRIHVSKILLLNNLFYMEYVLLNMEVKPTISIGDIYSCIPIPLHGPIAIIYF